MFCLASARLHLGEAVTREGDKTIREIMELLKNMKEDERLTYLSRLRVLANKQVPAPAHREKDY